MSYALIDLQNQDHNQSERALWSTVSTGCEQSWSTSSAGCHH